MNTRSQGIQHTEVMYPMRPIDGGPYTTCPPKLGRWATEPKWDGRRVLLHLPTMTLWNRKGGQLPDSIARQYGMAARMLSRRTAAVWCEAFEWMDCEGMGRVETPMFRGCLMLLDLPRCKGDYVDRRMAMRQLGLSELTAETSATKRDTAFIVPTHDDGSTDLIELWSSFASHPLIEGFVMKKLDSPYVGLSRPDGKSTTWVKHRFVTI